MYEIEQPDVLLWAFWCIQQYAKEAGKEVCQKKYGRLLTDMLRYIESGKHPNLKLDDNGLLRTNGKEHPVTWMNSTVNGKPVVPRTGYVVEFNALWYNALKFVASLAALEQNAEEAARLEDMAERCKRLSLIHISEPTRH